MSVLSALVVWNSNHVVDGWSRRWCEAIKKYRPNIYVCIYIYLSIYPPNTKWGYAWKPPQQTAVGSLPVFYSLLFHDDFLIPLKGQNQLTARPDVSLKKSMDELIEVKKALDINVYAGCVGVWTDMYDIFKGLGMIPPSKETWAHPFEFQTWKLATIWKITPSPTHKSWENLRCTLLYLSHFPGIFPTCSSQSATATAAPSGCFPPHRKPVLLSSG